jgi:exopolysaccharide/PEP-CTERM locus tyrosine autokinase
VSLIESALEKLRRGGEPEAERPTAHRPVVASSPAKPAQLVVPSSRDYNLKRIALNSKALRETGYLPQEGLERRFSDHYRHIKRPLIDKALSGSAEMRLIMISSALPGDGKTFTSLNLALSMARERDVSVLLVDADAPKARISEVLGLRADRGLLDALVDESIDVESLVVQTDIRGLEILPAGKLVEGAPELFASNRMDQIATRLAARNPKQLIVFDSAPLLVSSEARALLRVPGQVVLVVRSNVTPRQAAIDAAAYVDRRKLQGIVVNHVTYAPVGGYYGYSGYGEESEHSPGAH